MKRWKDHWNELLPYEKRFEVASGVLFCLCLIFLLLDILSAFGVVKIRIDAFAISRVLLVVGHACQVVVNWRIERNVANTFLISAIVFGLGAVWDIVKLFF